MKLTFSVTVLATLPSLINAAGINCKGSIKCAGAAISGWGGDDKPHAFTLSEYIHSLDDATWIPDRALIACTRTICAFLQNFGSGMWAREVKGMARNIVEHGCERCGSSPVDWPRNNDGTLGQLTFNYVNERCAHVLDGVCPSFADDQIVHAGEKNLKEDKEAKQAAKEAAAKEEEDKKLANMVAEKVKEVLAEEEEGDGAAAPSEMVDTMQNEQEEAEKLALGQKEDDVTASMFRKFGEEAPAETMKMEQAQQKDVEKLAAEGNMQRRRSRRRGVAHVVL